MRVIVTGGTGLIGDALVRSLAADGHDVVIVSRNPRQSGPMPKNVSYAKWDAKSGAGWGEFADGARAIVNLAGESIAGEGFLPARWTPERKKAIKNSRIHAGQAVVDAVKSARFKPGVLIQSSAVGYYGSTDMNKTITEESPAGNDFLATVCKEWEASTAEVEALGVRRVIIRTGVVISTKGGAFTRLAFPFKLFAGGPLGSGKQPFPWIHIDDEIRAIRALIDSPDASGPYNLTAPNPVSNAQFASALGAAMGRPSFVPAPGFAFNMAFGEVAQVVLEGQRVVPKRLLDMGFQFDYTDAEAAVRDLLANNK